MAVAQGQVLRHPRGLESQGVLRRIMVSMQWVGAVGRAIKLRLLRAETEDVVEVVDIHMAKVGKVSKDMVEAAVWRIRRGQVAVEVSVVVDRIQEQQTATVVSV